MTRVRAMQAADADAVAELFVRSFRAGRDVDRRLVARRLTRVCFDSPWRDPELAPWVYEAARGRIAGFLGVMPRRMRWRGRTLRAAVTGNLMVDPSEASAMVSLQILKACLAGPQDFTITDSALDATRRIVERSGGEAVRVLSLAWEREIQPLSARAARWLRWGRPRLWRAMAPLVRAADRMGRGTARGPWKHYANGCELRALDAARLCELHAAYAGDALVPEYDPDAIGWLLATPRGYERGLRAREVVGPGDRSLGWFVHYVERDGASEVLQLVAHPRDASRVVECLVDDAADAGARTLTGRVPPSLMLELSACKARFVTHDWTLLHAADPELRAAFHRGDVRFSPLDGERWTMRFVDTADRVPA